MFILLCDTSTRRQASLHIPLCWYSQLTKLTCKAALEIPDDFGAVAEAQQAALTAQHAAVFIHGSLQHFGGPFIKAVHLYSKGEELVTVQG